MRKLLPTKKLVQNLNKVRHKKKRELFVEKPWFAKERTFSSYPYILTVSFHKRNLFFILSNIRGQTKAWTSSGQAYFESRDKTTYMAVFQICDAFLKRIWSLGIRCIILKYINIHRRNRLAIQKSIQYRRRFRPLELISVFINNRIVFNGCRNKKKRRKRYRR